MILISNQCLCTALVLKQVFKFESIIKDLNLKCLLWHTIDKSGAILAELPATTHGLALPKVTAGFCVIAFTFSNQTNPVLKQKGSIMQGFPCFTSKPFPQFHSQRTLRTNLTFLNKNNFIILCGINTLLFLYVIYIFLVDIQPIQS